MFTHTQIWGAIDTLARRKGWSLSRLARHAGLDATKLNPSKRRGPDGTARWPSTGTIACLLRATGIDFADFSRLVEGAEDGASRANVAGVLLVDDDAVFREAAGCGLAAAGYDVHLAQDHRRALDMLADGREIDLLCTDLVMPDGLGGLALARLARACRPELPVLFVTGYPTAALADRIASSVLRKPVGARQLVAAIDRLLGS